MKYRNGSKIALGDKVQLSIPEGIETARVVMLGCDYSHLELEESFYKWVCKDKILKTDSIVIEWLNQNPLEHSDPNYARVGNYMFTAVSEDIKLI